MALMATICGMSISTGELHSIGRMALIIICYIGMKMDIGLSLNLLLLLVQHPMAHFLKTFLNGS
jgi:hypothetical protein